MKINNQNFNDPEKKPSLYLASPLFNHAERSFNLHIAEALDPYFKVFLPQRDAGLMLDFIDKGMDINCASNHVFQQDIQAVLECEYILAILDGRAIDEGVAFELGLAYANGKICLGLQTDIRRALPTGNNPMIVHSITTVFSSIAELMIWVNSLNNKFQFANNSKTRSNRAHI